MPTSLAIVLLLALARPPTAPPPPPVPHGEQLQRQGEVDAKARALRAFEAEKAAKAAAASAPEASSSSDKASIRRRGLRIAVNDLTSEGIDPLVVKIVHDSLTTELRKLDRVGVVSMQEIRTMLDLEGQRQLAGCAEDSCLAEIAEALGVDVLVTGSLTRVGSQHVFGLTRIDQQQAKTVGQVSRRLTPAGGEEFLAAIGPAVDELFPEIPLRPGQTRGVAREVALRLNPPPLPPAVFITTAVLTGGAAVGTVTALSLNLLTFDQTRRAVDNASPEAPLNGVTLKQQNDFIAQSFVVTVGLGIATGVGAAATGVIALFTNWNAE